MSNENTGYVSLRRLDKFFERIKEIFSTKEETEKKSQVKFVTWEEDD